ncbi:fatty acid CoA ligase family protein [Rhodococcus spongiicola]|uniref:Peptide synthase n=1 Tax=Rhodococcus spongiicola TaxID=2487352 RepID=A0A3S3E0W8_9NOCA|nr:fatty acid CoA ligase family protein [Rhodococcus spongiicola]RVW03397.1 peptide synthase [Rhodococcus spongiicola]
MTSAWVTSWQDRLPDTARRRPDAPAVTFADGPKTALPSYTDLTFAELDAWSEELAEQFAADGITDGTRTIVLVNPGPELYAILFGLFKAGAVPVVIDPGMGLRPMLRCLAAVDPQAFIGIPQAHAVRVLFRRAFRNVRATVTVGRRWGWGGRTFSSTGRTPKRPAQSRKPVAAADDLLMIAFTTGSTGPAKAVELTHGNLEAMLAQTQSMTEATEDETALVTLPMFGMLYLLLGARIVLPPLIPSRVGATDPLHVVNAINRFGVATLFASPAVLGPLLEHARTHKWTMSTVRAVFSGGAPVPDSVITGLRDVLPNKTQIHAGYGATEAIPISSIESRELLAGLTDRARDGAGTCIGRPVDGVEVRVIETVDEPLPRWSQAQPLDDGVGELVVRGPNVSTRYFWPDVANLTGKISEGDQVWHRTGDLGWIDSDGRIWFCGRKSQRVDTESGVLYPVQVEQVFSAVEGVARTALVGVGVRPHQRPVLCVELVSGADPDATIAAVRARATENPLTAGIETVLVHPRFPVDIRHNAKIGREQLAVWATTELDRRQEGTR